MLISPFSRTGYFVGVFFEQIIRLIIELIIILAIGSFFKAKVFSITLYKWIIGVVITILFVRAISIVLNNIMLYSKYTFLSQNTFFEIMLFFCGVSFPIQYLPSYLGWISYYIPLTQAISIFSELC